MIRINAAAKRRKGELMAQAEIERSGFRYSPTEPKAKRAQAGAPVNALMQLTLGRNRVGLQTSMEMPRVTSKEVLSVGMDSVTLGNKLAAGAFGVVLDAEDNRVPHEGAAQPIVTLSYIDLKLSEEAPMFERFITVFCSSMDEALWRAGTLEGCAGVHVHVCGGAGSGSEWLIASNVIDIMENTGVRPSWALASYEDHVGESMFVGRFVVQLNHATDKRMHRFQTRVIALATTLKTEASQNCRLALEAALTVESVVEKMVSYSNNKRDRAQLSKSLEELRSRRAAFVEKVDGRVWMDETAPDRAPLMGEDEDANEFLGFLDKFCAKPDWLGPRQKGAFYWEWMRIPSFLFGRGTHSSVQPRDMAVKFTLVDRDEDDNQFLKEVLVGRHVRHPCLLGYRSCGISKAGQIVPGVDFKGVHGASKTVSVKRRIGFCLMNEAAIGLGYLTNIMDACLNPKSTNDVIKRSERQKEIRKALSRLFGEDAREEVEWVASDPRGPERVAFFSGLLMKTTYEWMCGLEALHADGFVHFDVKSTNILLAVEPPQGPLRFVERARAVLADYGTVKPFGSYLPGPVGSTLNMAPEIVSSLQPVVVGTWTRSLSGERPYSPGVVGSHSKALDAWSAGVSIFRLFTGLYLFEHKDNNDKKLSVHARLTYGKDAPLNKAGVTEYLRELLGSGSGSAPEPDEARERKLGLVRAEFGCRVLDVVSGKTETLLDKLFPGWRTAKEGSPESDGYLVMTLVDGLLEWSPSRRASFSDALDGLEYSAWWEALDYSERALLRSLRTRRGVGGSYAISMQREMLRISRLVDVENLLSKQVPRGSAALAGIVRPITKASPLFTALLSVLSERAKELAPPAMPIISARTSSASPNIAENERETMLFMAACAAIIVAAGSAEVYFLAKHARDRGTRPRITANELSGEVVYSMTSDYLEDTESQEIGDYWVSKENLLKKLASAALATFLPQLSNGYHYEQYEAITEFVAAIDETCAKLIDSCSSGDDILAPRLSIVRGKVGVAR
jgi:serine/threonine protein kinase